MEYSELAELIEKKVGEDLGLSIKCAVAYFDDDDSIFMLRFSGAKDTIRDENHPDYCRKKDLERSDVELRYYNSVSSALSDAKFNIFRNPIRVFIKETTN